MIRNKDEFNEESMYLLEQVSSGKITRKEYNNMKHELIETWKEVRDTVTV